MAGDTLRQPLGAVLRDAGVLLAEPDGRKRNYRVVEPRAERMLRCLWASTGPCGD